MKLSIIIPAFNEAKRIESCLTHLSAALRANAAPNLESEIIVADNNSTDATAQLARNAGAQVVFEPINQIARARNAGAAAATGDWFLFVDADTHVSPETLGEMLAFIGTATCVGGGSTLRYDKPDLIAHCFLFVSNPIVRALKLLPGCFIFCRTDTFRALSGFDHAMFAGEDADFGWRLGRWSRAHGLRVKILCAHPPVTSLRKVELYGWKELLVLIARWILFPRRTTRDKTRLHVFYDGRR
jgi:glycosyltransferase involved in cell wall biosynthesis